MGAQANQVIYTAYDADPASACRPPGDLMPGLCGFVTWGHDKPPARLQALQDDLRHHPAHHALPGFHDRNVAAGLVLRRADAPGIHWQGRNGVQVWVDGEAFDKSGPMPSDALAQDLAAGIPKARNGSFAAVIYDPDAGQLRFVTDPFGSKFLYLRVSLGARPLRGRRWR
jgi:hypothetical protein